MRAGRTQQWMWAFAVLAALNLAAGAGLQVGGGASITFVETFPGAFL